MTSKLTSSYDRQDATLDAELAEVLSVISVISKRLAKKVRENQKSKGDNDMEMNDRLTGETVKVKHTKGDTDAYPWSGIAVPILITKEYPKFFIGTVLPHYAPSGFGISKPYTVTLDKHDIKTGVIIIEIEGGKHE